MGLEWSEGEGSHGMVMSWIGISWQEVDELSYEAFLWLIF